MPEFVIDNAPYIFGGIALLAGMTLVGIALFTMKQMRETEGWPNVQGEIVVSKIVQKKKRRQKGDSHTFRVEYEYIPQIEYRYKVKGAEHRGDRIWFIEKIFHNEMQALIICDEYPVGKVAPVYYDPWQPEKSVLKPGVDLGVFLMFFLLGGLFIAVGVFVLVNF